MRLQQIVFPPPAFTDEERPNQEAQLRRTQWAQPALAAAALAQLNLLAAAGVRPTASAGTPSARSPLCTRRGCSSAEFLAWHGGAGN